MTKIRAQRMTWTWARGLAAVALAGLTLAAGCRTVLDQNAAINRREVGIAAYNRGEYELARQKFAAAIEADPTGYRSRYWMGKTELALGRPVVAQSEFEYALEVASKTAELRPDILDGLAEALYAQGNRDRLHTFLAEASINGTTRDYLREAKYLVATGDPDAAVVAYRKAVRFADRDDAGPYLAIADFYESVNDVPNAVTSLRYAYYIDPKEPTIPDRFRKFGIVPGPTLKLEPPKPQMLNE